MSKVQVLQDPPRKAQILGPVETLSYFDVRALPISCNLTAMQAWNIVMSRPLPGLGLAFKIRDAVSSLFGVKKIGGFARSSGKEPVVGEKLDFFLIEGVSQDALILTERDRHLDVMTSITTTDGFLAITSSVVTHNLFGKLYMIPVGIAHKVIVTLMLARVSIALNTPSETLPSR